MGWRRRIGREREKVVGRESSEERGRRETEGLKLKLKL